MILKWFRKKKKIRGIPNSPNPMPMPKVRAPRVILEVEEQENGFVITANKTGQRKCWVISPYSIYVTSDFREAFAWLNKSKKK